MTALAAVLVVLLVLVALTALAALIVMRRLHRPLELVPGVRGPVPLAWRWSLTRPALLQRRLVVALAGVRLAAGASPEGSARVPWAELVAETQRLAVAVEARLVAASRQPRALRQKLVAQLEPEVAQVEEVAERLVASIGTWAAGEPELSATRLLERLKAVDEALADVARAEAAGALGPVPAASILPPTTATRAGTRHGARRGASGPGAG